MCLRMHDLPVWPHIEVADIVRDAARVCVDEGMFVPARTLSVAVARMNDGEGDKHRHHPSPVPALAIRVAA